MQETEKILRAADEAMIRGDMEGYWSAHADDCVAHVAGKNSLSGTYKGLDQIHGLFARFMERAGEFTFENHDYLGSADHAVALQRSHFNKDGKRFDSDDIFIFHVRDGKISEFWMSSLNQDEVDTFIG